MKYTLVSSLLATAVVAFPAVLRPDIAEAAASLAGRSVADQSLEGRKLSPQAISKLRTNCGPTPCLTFSEDQFVSTTGEYAYASPAANQIRGPCPGLNAAANHGYLPRSGIVSQEETISGLADAYGLTPEVTAFLSAYAIILDGNVAQMVWSIGGPLPSGQLGSGVLGSGQGLSYSHNEYEGDGSIARFDAYTNNGDAHSLDVGKFQGVYDVGGKEDRYTLDKFASRFAGVQDEAIATNPYYFSGGFSTVAVVPAAYNFVINLMSNHTKQQPSGYLDGSMFKTFFGISGKSGSFVWKRGQERIPENWYRRPIAEGYNGAGLAGDVAINYQAYPKSLKFGGNTGTVNSYTGVDVENVTGGVFNAETLFKGNNFQCFFFSFAQQGLPQFLSKGENIADKLLGKFIAPLIAGLNCPQLGTQSTGLFNDYPGRNYMPKGKDTNYKA